MPGVECFLCHDPLPSDNYEMFTSHMQDHHNAYYNLEFMFATVLLDEEELSQTLEFMKNVKVKLEIDHTQMQVEEQNNYIEVNEEVTITRVKKKEDDNVKLKAEIGNDYDDDDELEDDTVIYDENNVDLDASTEQMEIQPDLGDFSLKEDVLECKPCDLTFDKKSDKNYHYFVHHKQAPHCEECKLYFKKEESYQKHLKTRRHRKEDGRSPICPECGKQFGSYYLMKDHLNSVHDHEPSVCHLCYREVKNKKMLQRHLRLFHKEMETCPECGKSVKKLKMHMATMHTKNENKKFHCQICGKGFPVKSRLTEHLAIHSDIKPYSCRFNCGLAFANSGNRNKHEQTHDEGSEITQDDINKVYESNGIPITECTYEIKQDQLEPQFVGVEGES